MKASALKGLPILVACALLGATGAASAATYTLSLTRPGSGTLVAPDSVSSLSFTVSPNVGSFTKLVDTLSPAIHEAVANGTLFSQVDFITALSTSQLETFAFQDVVLVTVVADSTPQGVVDETVGFNFLSETTSTSTTPLPAALPLFATGLGGLGLVGWRRKRKAQAIA